MSIETEEGKIEDTNEVRNESREISTRFTVMKYYIRILETLCANKSRKLTK